ncbi:MAG: hypothetical protein UIM53_09225, partial [Acutalibacteraceae bacterium]|nr:hypothetical protein [Acutalibacteraceae bacterium]
VMPVKWNQVIEKLRNMNIDFLVDIGPNKIIKNLVLENHSFSEVLAYDEPEDSDKLKERLKK